MIEHSSWQDCLRRYDSRQTFFYVDPPYRCPGAKSYRHFFTDEDHCALAAALLAAKGKWLFSYNDDPLIRSLYSCPGIVIEEVQVCHSLARSGRRKMAELLIRNY